MTGITGLRSITNQGRLLGDYWLVSNDQVAGFGIMLPDGSCQFWDELGRPFTTREDAWEYAFGLDKSDTRASISFDLAEVERANLQYRLERLAA